MGWLELMEKEERRFSFMVFSVERNKKKKGMHAER
jgi:hypothetical protein